MLRKSVLLSVFLAIGGAGQAQVTNANDTSAVAKSTDTATPVKAARHRHKKEYGPLGRFNYLYLRVATYFPATGFANPVAAGFPGSDNFRLTDDVNHSYRLGYESGKVRHIMKLNLGTPMLKLAINSGIALQVFGKGKQATDNATASTGGFYLLRLGLGPQLTFKPIKEVRVGVYYRPGIAAFYTSYLNEQRTPFNPDRVRVDKVDAHFLHYAYNGDLGLDFAYNALSFGLCFSMMKTSQPAGKATDVRTAGDFNVYSSYTERNGQQEGDKRFSPISPEVKFNRFGVSIGFML